MLEDVRFESLFDRVRELHTCVGEKLHAVIVVGIVRGGNDDAGLKIVLANEAGDAGCGDDACKGNRTAGLREPGGEEGGNVWARFARVHADENVGGGVFAKQICSEGAASCEKGGVIERRRAGNAANSISSEKFFGHERLAAKT